MATAVCCVLTWIMMNVLVLIQLLMSDTKVAGIPKQSIIPHSPSDMRQQNVFRHEAPLFHY